METNVKQARFLSSIEHNTVILCERHARVFETMAITAEVPHTIIELDDEDAPEHCHGCDLVLARAYIKRLEKQPGIILPGDFQ
tara:strand:- start:361 stop:609 length:249 start_codon:yes stop_codon:yes gene_type:complete